MRIDLICARPPALCGIGKLDSQVVTVIGGDECRPGPDLLGVCEVENRFVIDRLIDLVNATRRG